MDTVVASRVNVPGRRPARAKAQDAVEHEAVLDVAGAAAGGTGDHTRGKVMYLHPLHARIRILILMMLIVVRRLAKEIFSIQLMHLTMNGPCLG